MAVVNGELYVFGGVGAQKVVEKLEGSAWNIQKGLQRDSALGGIVVVN